MQLPCARCSPGLGGRETFLSLRTRSWKNSVPKDLVKTILIFSASTHSLVISSQSPLFLHPIVKTTRFSHFFRLFPYAIVQFLSRVQLFMTPWTAARQASLSFTISLSCLDSWPLSQWCHPTISSSVIPLSSCLQSFPASGSLPMRDSELKMCHTEL